MINEDVRWDHTLTLGQMMAKSPPFKIYTHSLFVMETFACFAEKHSEYE